MKFVWKLTIPWLCAAAPVAAQEHAPQTPAAPVPANETIATIPDPASVTVPAITGSRDPKVIKNGAKYYYFWRAETSYEEAYADLADCYRFLPMAEGNAALLPMFIAWRGTAEERDETSPATQNYGLVGALIGALIGGSGVQRATQLRLHRCLEPLGYQRFPVPKETWQAINDNFSPASIAVQAKIISSPRPDADPVGEMK